MSLRVRAVAGLVQLAVVLALALFLPAWTVRWWQAWTFLAVFFGAATSITVDLMRRDPALLARRVAAGAAAETRPLQKVVQGIASLAFVAVFLVASLDRRFAWSHVPAALSIVGDALVALGLGFVSLVFRANTFTSATIEIAKEQKVVSTGPYALVRHPMYAGAFVMLVGVPLALGSWWSVLAVPPLVAVIVWRLLDEEKLLAAELTGYAEYRTKVKWRLVPGVW